MNHDECGVAVASRHHEAGSPEEAISPEEASSCCYRPFSWNFSSFATSRNSTEGGPTLLLLKQQFQRMFLCLFIYLFGGDQVAAGNGNGDPEKQWSDGI